MEDNYSLVTPFWIDTDAYSDRDRVMFVAGFEFARIVQHVRHDDSSLETTIHRENESRVRMVSAKFGRICQIEPCEPQYDPNGTWSYLTILAK